MSLYNTQSISDWLFNTQSRVLQADWLILENNEKPYWNVNMPYYVYGYIIVVPTGKIYG